VGYSLKFSSDERDMPVMGNIGKSELLERSRELDNFLRKKRLESFLTLSFIVFSVIVIFLIFSEDRIGLRKYLFLYSAILLFGLVVLLITRLNAGLSSRKLISYCLFKIAHDIDSGKKPRNLVRLLFDITRYTELEEIHKMDLIFEEDEIRHQQFLSNLNDFAMRLNHAAVSKNLQLIDANKLYEIAIVIFERKRDILERSGKLSHLYNNKMSFGPLPYDISVFWQSRYFRFVSYLLIYGIAFSLVCELHLVDQQNAVMGFLLASAAFLSGILRGKSGNKS
jgi:hypothetical protein